MDTFIQDEQFKVDWLDREIAANKKTITTLTERLPLLEEERARRAASIASAKATKATPSETTTTEPANESVPLNS